MTSQTIITQEDIRKIAHLARLKISTAEMEKYADSLSHILDMITQPIQSLNTEHVTPMSSPLDVTLTLREDTADALNQRDELQKLAPKTESGFYLVPQVIE